MKKAEVLNSFFNKIKYFYAEENKIFCFSIKQYFILCLLLLVSFVFSLKQIQLKSNSILLIYIVYQDLLADRCSSESRMKPLIHFIIFVCSEGWICSSSPCLMEVLSAKIKHLDEEEEKEM